MPGDTEEILSQSPPSRPSTASLSYKIINSDGSTVSEKSLDGRRNDFQLIDFAERKTKSSDEPQGQMSLGERVIYDWLFVFNSTKCNYGYIRIGIRKVVNMPKKQSTSVHKMHTISTRFDSTINKIIQTVKMIRTVVIHYQFRQCY